MIAQAECSICEEAITQPICISCLEQEMEVWLRERRPELVDEMKAKADELWIPRGGAQCLKCKSDMDVCAYCFTKHMLEWLKKHPQLIPEFMMYFNFDLHYHGYAKELLELV